MKKYADLEDKEVERKAIQSTMKQYEKEEELKETQKLKHLRHSIKTIYLF